MLQELMFHEFIITYQKHFANSQQLILGENTWKNQYYKF